MLYCALTASQLDDLSPLVRCSNAVSLWFHQNALLFNPGKMEALMFMTRQWLVGAFCMALRSGTSTVSRSVERDGSHRASGFLPALRQQLHWLPIRQRITYKLVTLTFKAKYCQTRLYLHEQLRDHQFARELRSTTAPLFYRPFVSTVFASRVFHYSAPQASNCLGTSTRSENTFSSFRCCLKSELFAAAYDT